MSSSSSDNHSGRTERSICLPNSTEFLDAKMRRWNETRKKTETHKLKRDANRWRDEKDQVQSWPISWEINGLMNE